jgi:hypothetical protein
MKTFSFALIALLFVTACEPPTQPIGATEPPTISLPANYKSITPDEAQALILSDKSLTILDVRTEAEYGPSRIPEPHNPMTICGQKKPPNASQS